MPNLIKYLDLVALATICDLVKLDQVNRAFVKQGIKVINQTKNKYECSRAILVGHNAHFDSSFLNAAVERNGIKRSPFHPFSVLDTVTLGALATNQTVLARICELLDIDYDSKEAHSAAYDSDVTARVFCKIINKYS